MVYNSKAFGYTVEKSARGTAGGPYYDFWWWEHGLELRKRIQQTLKDDLWYTGPVDGAWGPNTIKGLQAKFAADWGIGGDIQLYSGPIDGAPGRNLVAAVNTFAMEWARGSKGDPAEYQTLLAGAGRGENLRKYPAMVWRNVATRIAVEPKKK